MIARTRCTSSSRVSDGSGRVRYVLYRSHHERPAAVWICPYYSLGRALPELILPHIEIGSHEYIRHNVLHSAPSDRPSPCFKMSIVFPYCTSGTGDFLVVSFTCGCSPPRARASGLPPPTTTPARPPKAQSHPATALRRAKPHNFGAC